MTDQIAQANNALVFPGLGLGVAVTKASRISEAMIDAAADAADAADAVADDRTAHRRRGRRRRVAKAAVAEVLNQVELTNPIQQVHDAIWRPDYPQIEVVED